MDEAGVQIRAARPEDVEQIRESIRFTLANPEGRPQRKRYEEAISRNEILVLSRADRVLAFIEWHSRVDGVVTIRDLGAAGETPEVGWLRRLLRELLRMLAPPLATVKVREDQTVWVNLFRETPGFVLEGREYSRPHWRLIWGWTPEAERAAAKAARPPAPRPSFRPAPGPRPVSGARPRRGR